MDGPGLPSIQLEDIDPEKCYFNPGCAMSLYRPEAIEDILYILNRRFLPTKLHTTCCRHDPKLPQGSTIINNCAGCDRRFRSLYEGIQTVSIWKCWTIFPRCRCRPTKDCGSLCMIPVRFERSRRCTPRYEACWIK